MGGTGLEPVTPSLSSFGLRRGEALAAVRTSCRTLVVARASTESNATGYFSELERA